MAQASPKSASWYTPPMQLPLNTIKLPTGFRIATLTADVPNARQMALGAKNTLFVGSMSAGAVYAVKLARDYKAERVYTIARGLNMPSGIAFNNGALYVAAVNRVLRYDRIEDRLTDPPDPVVVSSAFPSDRHHGWKYLGFGPDGWLYVPVGAPCNVCERTAPKYASITRMKKDGSGLEVFASGVRNSVGFDWHPQTKELWFTDNGRDMMGDDVPPDELNRAPKKGLHFGFPYLHGKDVKDPQFWTRSRRSDYALPVQELGPHVAAIGMKFYTGKMFPAKYRNQVFIAEHGSWNRSTPIGYRVMMVTLKGNVATGYEPFAHGWLQGRRPWGRPADVLVLPDGSMLISDDHAGAIYRITYAG